jgi:cytochrome c biogenesis protein
VNVAPNSPLDVNETKMFLTGHGYAPRVTVRDGRGDVTFSGSVIFLPLNSTFMSDGVVKAPDARPTGLGFEGLFIPTAGFDERGPFSDFPDTLDPRLVLTAYRGDLGLSDGVPQSVFTLEKGGLTQFEEEGRPFVRSLQVGDTMRLPGGQGSLTFRGIDRFANFQVAYDPGKEISLLAAVMLLGGLVMSLTIRRRRVWLRVRPTREGVWVVELATLNLGRRPRPERELRDLAVMLGGPTGAVLPPDNNPGPPRAPEPATAATREG